MATYRITPDKLGRALINEGHKTAKAYRRGVTRAAHRGKARLIAATKEKKVDYLGQFRNSFQVDVRPEAVVLYNDAPHAGIIELGARPHPVSKEGIDAIAQWAKTKLMGGAPRHRRGPLTAKADARFAKRVDAYEAEARSIAFAIARKIGREGQRGRFIFRDELPTLARFVAVEVHRSIEQMRKGPGPDLGGTAR